MIESQTTVENGFRETEIGLLPSDWDVARLGDVAVEFFGGGTPSTKKAEYWDGEILWTTSAYIDDSLYLDRGAGYITQKGLDESSSRLVPQGNLLIGTRVGVGKVAINIRDTAISQDLTAAIIDNSVVDREFLAYAIKWDKTQSAFLASMRGTTIKGIPRADLVRIPIPRPPLPQQRRIAAVLNAIQDAIAAQEDVIAEARALKRSLMQRLFTYGPGREHAETKETEIGEIPAHWELKNVESIKANVKSAIVSGPFGSNIGKKFFVDKGVPLIRGNNLTKGDQRFVDNGYVFITEQKAEELKSCEARAGDLVFTAAGTIGQVGLIPHDSLYPRYIISNKQLRVRVNSAIATPEYLFYWFTGEIIQTLIQQRRRGTSIPVINLSILRALPVPLPSLTEQNQITGILRDLDFKIAVEEDRKIALQDLFKSTLHQLMTGQIWLLSDKGAPYQLTN